MSTQFQWVFDNAESINFNRRAIVAQTTTRSGITRTASRGGQIWRFEVSMPEGMSWTAARPYIEGIDAADRFTPNLIQINNPGYNSWLTTSQTGLATTQGTWTNGNRVVTLGHQLAIGDIVQLGTGYIYSITGVSSGSATLNRPVIDADGSGTVTIGPGVTWTLLCSELPQWNIFARDQVSWSGPFRFTEVMI